jgi:hypothetical protein
MFCENFEKQASNLVRGLEHVGLGTLAVPSIAGMVSKKTSSGEKKKDAAEVAGLGTLALGVEAGHEGSAINRMAKKYLPKLMKA